MHCKSSIVALLSVLHLTCVLSETECDASEINGWKTTSYPLPFVSSLQVIGYDSNYDPHTIHVIGGNEADNYIPHYSFDVRDGSYTIYPNISSNGDLSLDFQGVTVNNIVYFSGTYSSNVRGLNWFDLSDPSSTTYTKISNENFYSNVLATDGNNVLFLINIGNIWNQETNEWEDAYTTYKYYIDTGTFVVGPNYGDLLSSNNFTNSINYETCQFFEATDQLFCFGGDRDSDAAQTVRVLDNVSNDALFDHNQTALSNDTELSEWYLLENTDVQGSYRMQSIVWNNLIYLIDGFVQTFCPYTYESVRKDVGWKLENDDYLRMVLVSNFTNIFGDNITENLLVFSSYSQENDVIQYNNPNGDAGYTVTDDTDDIPNEDNNDSDYSYSLNWECNHVYDYPLPVCISTGTSSSVGAECSGDAMWTVTEYSDSNDCSGTGISNTTNVTEHVECSYTEPCDYYEFIIYNTTNCDENSLVGSQQTVVDQCYEFDTYSYFFECESNGNIVFSRYNSSNCAQGSLVYQNTSNWEAIFDDEMDQYCATYECISDSGSNGDSGNEDGESGCLKCYGAFWINIVSVASAIIILGHT